jgi:predicted RNA-binding Zn-ribbon protein involved in translation (DUF1610 family)
VGWIGRRPGWNGRPAAPREAPAQGPAEPVSTKFQAPNSKGEEEPPEGVTANGEIEAERAVMWRPVKCPNCGSRECPRYSGSEDKRVRYHKCEACGWRFKSIEED